MNTTKDSFYKFITTPSGLGLCIFVLLFIVSLFPTMGIDEGVWSYIGTAWIKFGIAPLKGALDDKTPGIHIIYAVSNYLFGVNAWFPRLLGCISLTWSAFVVYSIAIKLRDHFAGILAMLIFGLSMSWKFTEGSYSAQTESFMVLFNLLAIKIILDIYSDKPKNLKYKLFLCGFFIGCSLSFKQIAVFAGAAIVIIYCLISYKDKSEKKNFFFDLLFISSGCLTALLLFFLPLLLSGVSFGEYFAVAWWNIVSMFVSQSGSAASLPVRINGFFSSWRSSEMLLFYPLLIMFFIYRSKFKNNFFVFYGLMIWMFFDFLAVNAVGYYWNHQFKQIIPSVSVISGLSLSFLWEKLSGNNNKNRRNFLAIFLIITVLWFPYNTFVAGITSPKTGHFNQLGKIIRNNTREDDYVYIFSTLNYGYGMVVQAYSERKSPTKYFAPFSLDLKGAVKQISKDIMINSTRFVVVPSVIQHRLPEPISNVISKYYVRKSVKYNFIVYEKIY